MGQQSELYKKQQRRNNNSYNPISIRLNTYNQQPQQPQQQQQQSYNHRYQGQYSQNHHYHNGNAVQPISVNSSMMNTLRQKMKMRIGHQIENQHWFNSYCVMIDEIVYFNSF